jgi:nitrate reductase alpha subunit
MEPGARAAGHESELTLSLLITHDSVADVAFPYFGGNENPHFRSVKQEPVLTRRVPSKTLTLADGREKRVVSVYDLVLANYGLDRGLQDSNAADSYDQIKAYTPAWESRSPAYPRI